MFKDLLQLKKTCMDSVKNVAPRKVRDNKTAPEPISSMVAPHPIPEGMEGRQCPITGFFASEVEAGSLNSVAALKVLQADPDIIEEEKALIAHQGGKESPEEILLPVPKKILPLNVIDRAHRPSAETRALIHAVGGLPTLRRFTNAFYQKAFADPHLDKFIASHEDPHGERFATWIAEKFGDGTPWTEERKTRPVRRMKIGNEILTVAFDRSSAHFAAWHSPKREPSKYGDHFKLDDARVWMRLHFWAARDAGLFKHAAFMDYYIRFIGHFISIYSSKSPPFTRESARWSADPKNIQQYLDAGHVMVDVIGQPLDSGLAQLPADERTYTGSASRTPSWPYELRPIRN